MMPGMDGIELTRKVRSNPQLNTTYIIMLTALIQKKDIVTGLKAGADDYITKPFDNKELHARIKVGVRIVELEKHLKDRIIELEEALKHIKRLQGLVPICAYCKKIRSDDNYWQQVEGYISERSDAEFSHSICPECYEEFVEPELEELKRKMDKKKREAVE
jgi:response regulator RpfG family c-di-GMP phosphodiesterase